MKKIIGTTLRTILLLGPMVVGHRYAASASLRR